MGNSFDIFSLLLLLGGFFFVFIIIAIVVYVLGAIGMSRMAERQGVDHPWLAYIPLANTFILGQLADEDVHPSLRGKTGLVLLIVTLVSSAFQILALLALVLYYYVVFHVYKRYTDNYMACLIISIVTFGFAIPIILFIIRNNPMVEEEYSNY